MQVLEGVLDHAISFAKKLGLDVEDSTYGNDLCQSILVGPEDIRYQIYLPNSKRDEPDDEEFNYYIIRYINDVEIVHADPMDKFEFEHLLLMIAGNDETFNLAYQEIINDIPILRRKLSEKGVEKIYRFKELHDYVDANTYGIDMGDNIRDEPDNTEFFKLMNNMQCHLDCLIQGDVLKIQ